MDRHTRKTPCSDYDAHCVTFRVLPTFSAGVGRRGGGGGDIYIVRIRLVGIKVCVTEHQQMRSKRRQ